MNRHNKKIGNSLARLASAVSAVAAAMLAQAAHAGVDLTPQPTSGSPVYNAPVAGNSNSTSASNGNGSQGNYATISLSGSTAMRGYTTSPGLSYLPPDTDIFLSSGTFMDTTSGTSYQLDPNNLTATSSSSLLKDVPAVELEWHEQGSVEGILEMVTDEVGPLSSTPPSVVNRTPSITNPVWINQTAYGAPITGAANTKGWTLDAFNNPPTTPNPNQQAPVQMAIADVVPLQAFAYTTSVATAPAINPSANPWQLLPGQAGYGVGNPALPLSNTNNTGLGIASGRQQLQNQTFLNMPATQTNPATGGTFGSGPWNTGGVTNVQTNTVAVTATDIAANPGTGLTRINQTDAQWLQLTGRLQNGALFNVAARDVNSGTRNTFADNSGIDPSWAVGTNDNGSTLAATAAQILSADAQDVIGHDANGVPTIKFSGKTSGSLLRATVANNRMALGTLVLGDTISDDPSSGAAIATPIRSLAYNPNPSNTAAGQNSANYIYDTPENISNGTYVAWQQEQYVTVKAPNPTDTNLTAAQWAATSDLQTGIQGDTPNTSVPLAASVTSGSNVITDSGNGNVSGGGFVVGQVIKSAAFPTGTTVTSITYNDGTNGTVNGSVASVTVSNPANETANVNDLTVSGGDVANFRANILNAQKSSATNAGFNSALDPGDQLAANKFLLPQFMQVQKAYDGGPVTSNTLVGFNINTNPNGYNATAAGFFFNRTTNASILTGLTVNDAAGVGTATGPFTVPQGSGGGYYGQATRGSTVTANGTIGGQAAVAFVNGNVGITSSNYLFGNFNNNGIRDYSSFMTSVAALKALYDAGAGVDVNDGTAVTGTSASDATVVPDALLNAAQTTDASLTGTTFTTPLSSLLGSTSTFVGQRGPSNGQPTTVTSAPSTGKGVSKGDLIVMGDYQGSGRFDGRDIYEMAIGTSLSDSYSTTTLSSQDAVRTGVLNKNGALDFAQAATSDATYDVNGNATNDSAFIRQSARAVLVSPTLPSGATEIYSISNSAMPPAIIGYAYTFDPTGSEAFNANDVNRDGLTDINDAVAVDNANGQSYTNLANQLAATIPTPVTGTAEPVNLAVIQQVDNEPAIGAADVAAINTGLTGTGNANWYGYNVQKTGPGTINWARTGGTVTVYSGASLEVSNGAFQVTGSIDPFSDNNASGPTVGNHVALSIDHGASVQLRQPGAIDPVTGLNSKPGVTISALTIDTSTGSKLDTGNNTLNISYGAAADPVQAVRGYLLSAYKSGSWTGAGLTSDVTVANPSKYALGYTDNTTTHVVSVKLTVPGDTDLSGSTDFNDLTTVAQFFGTSVAKGNNTQWTTGDVNYDGQVDFNDLTLVAQYFGDSMTKTEAGTLPTSFLAQYNLALAEIKAAGGTTSVPEPGTISLAVLAGAGLLARRRKQVAKA